MRSAAASRRTQSKPRFQVPVGNLVIGPREKAYLRQVVASNRLSYGPFSQRFEDLFAKIHGVRHAIFCSSGTAALQLSVAALKEMRGWRDGDEVIVPSVTFVATANVLIHAGLRPVFVDVDPATYNLNPRKLKGAMTPRVRGIVPVHLLGLPCDMDPIMEFARSNELSVIEDSCETMFASYGGRMVGSFGDVGCFSTYVAHYIVAGIGGFATTNDSRLAEVMRSLMNHGRDNIYVNIDDDNRASGKRFREIVARRFSFVRPGYNFRATELEAAIGLAQLEGHKNIVRKRKQNAAYLTRGLSDLSDRIQLASTPEGRDHVFMLYPIVLRKEPKRKLVEDLETRGIETRDLLPLVNQPFYRRLYGDLEARLPVAAWLNRSGFYIGCHQYLGRPQLQYVVDVIHDFFQ